MDKKKIAEILLKVNAVSFNPTYPFKFASGIFSPIFVDCRVINSYPEERKLIVKELADTIESYVGKNRIDVIVGAAHSGISLASYLCQELKIPVGYIRTSAKEYGKRKLIEGFFKKGCRVLILSDIMSTELDIATSVKIIKEAGGEIVFCLTIFSNNLDFVENFLKSEKISFKSLTDLRTLLEIATSSNKLSLEQAKTIDEWMKDPQFWDQHRRAEMCKWLAENKVSIGRILVKNGVVTFNLKKDFEYASGKSGPIYVDNRLLMAVPIDWQEVIDSMIRLIVNQIGIQNVDVIAGTSTAGIPHAAFLAAQLGLPMVYVKSKIDEYGKFTRVEGLINKGQKTILIEDTLNTGQSSISAIKALQESGAIVENCIAIFDYGRKACQDLFSRERVNMIALTNLDIVLAAAVRENFIQPQDSTAIINRIRSAN